MSVTAEKYPGRASSAIVHRIPKRSLSSQSRAGCLTHAEWRERWAPECPDGNPQRVAELTAFRLKGPDLLQVRVVLRHPGDLGVCQLVVEEYPEQIYVRALVCQRAGEVNLPVAEEIDCGCRWYLDSPLGDRRVIDIDNDLELPLLIPQWGEERASEIIPRPPGNLWPEIPGRTRGG